MSSSSTVRTVPALGGPVGSLLRAALPSVPGLNLLPGVRKVAPAQFQPISLRLEDVAIDSARVDAYASVCGFARRDTVPLTYPHLYGFALQLAIMADPAFAWVAMGSVHLSNTISSYRPIGRDEQLAVTTSVALPRPHRRGTALDFSTEVSTDGDVVWESVSTYLVRGRGTEDAAPGLDLDRVVDGTTTWDLPADLGRRYGAVSGDLNPIHLTPLTARPLGFRRHIAHGMWTKARCLAALENRLPDAVRVEAVFKKPVFLPGPVGFGMVQSADGAGQPGAGQPDWDFSLTDPRTGAPHLIGRTRALTAGD